MAFGKHARKIQQKCMRPFGKYRSNENPSGSSVGLCGDHGVVSAQNAHLGSGGHADLGAKDPCLCLCNREVFQKHLGSKTSKVFPNDVIFKIP